MNVCCSKNFAENYFCILFAIKFNIRIKILVLKQKCIYKLKLSKS